MRDACVIAIVLCAGCGDDGGRAAVDAGVDAPAEGGLVVTPVAWDGEMPAVFDVVDDVTGDGRDDVVATYFSSKAGPEVIVMRLDGARLVRVAAIEGGDAALNAPRVIVEDVVGDARKELVIAHPYEGVLRAWTTPIAGDVGVGDAVAAIAGPQNSFFATAWTRGALLAGGARAIVVATPGEPEEACFSSEPPVLLARPWPASGTVEGTAAARMSGGDPFDCLGSWLEGGHDWTGDGAADLIVAATRGGARLVAGPIEDGRALETGVTLAVERAPYGGYGVAAGAVLDVDGDGRVELALSDLSLGALRVWAAPIEAASSTVVEVGGATIVDGPRPADLDGDGDADVAVIDELFSATMVTVAAMPGGGVRWTAPMASGTARTGDLDGDGRAELLIRDATGFRIARVP